MEITIKEIIIIILGGGAIGTGWMVISSENPMHSVVALVLTFANAAGLLIMLEVEFLALLFIIVYAGAIAILILFVVMMLNIKLVELRDSSSKYVPIGFIIGFVLLIELICIFIKNGKNYTELKTQNYYHTIKTYSNIENIGNLLYTEDYIYFIIASIILLVAMIGAIVLTLSHEEAVKRQDLFSQISSDHSSIVYAPSSTYKS